MQALLVIHRQVNSRFAIRNGPSGSDGILLICSFPLGPFSFARASQNSGRLEPNNNAVFFRGQHFQYDGSSSQIFRKTRTFLVRRKLENVSSLTFERDIYVALQNMTIIVYGATKSNCRSHTYSTCGQLSSVNLACFLQLNHQPSRRSLWLFPLVA